jgi:hypothetical protein
MPHGVTTRRQLDALRGMQSISGRYLSLGELPRGVGRGIMAQLTELGWAETGQSDRFSCRMGWRITLDGLTNLGESPCPAATAC